MSATINSPNLQVTPLVAGFTFDPKDIKPGPDGIPQFPQHHPESNHCKSMRRFFTFGYTVGGTALTVHTGYTAWEEFLNPNPKSDTASANRYLYAGTLIFTGTLLYNSILVPFDGPSGEIAAGGASMAAFARAGIEF